MCVLLCEKLCDFFFFFQAEDGIRDVAVTGVQTCALPILVGKIEDRPQGRVYGIKLLEPAVTLWDITFPPFVESQRSEERRVGKSVDLGGRRIIKKKKKKKRKLYVKRIRKPFTR